MDHLGKAILEEIKQRGLTQQYVADKIGVPRQTVNQFKNRKIFDSKLLSDLKTEVGIDFTDFYERNYTDVEIDEAQVKYGLKTPLNSGITLHIQIDPNDKNYQIPEDLIKKLNKAIRDYQEDKGKS